MIDEVNGMTLYDRFVINIILYISSCTKCSIYKIYIYIYIYIWDWHWFQP